MVTEFPKEKMEAIKREIDRSLEAGAHPIAAFDADGTLWESDMGEGMFKYQIANNLLPHLPEDPWEHYLNMHYELSPQQAFLWLAQINEGLPIDQVRQWAKDSVEAQGNTPVFEAQKDIVGFLQARGVDVYVVTASVKWAVEPAAELYEIPQEKVIGVTTKVINGLVTSEQDGPITYREGKVEGLHQMTNGLPPFFAAGNTTGDLPLLEAATHVRLVMASAHEGHINYEKERKMLALAERNNWFYHSYID